jgi:nitrogen-specific signal transduction histidine kinase
LTLEVDVVEALIEVRGDRERIARVLINLLSNAYRHTIKKSQRITNSYVTLCRGSAPNRCSTESRPYTFGLWLSIHLG